MYKWDRPTWGLLMTTISSEKGDDPAFLARRMCCDGFFVRFLGSPGRSVAPCWDKLRSRDFVSLPSNNPSDYKILAAAQTEKIYTTGRWKQVQRHEARALGRCALAPKATAVTAAGWNCWDKNILSKSRCTMIFVGFCGYGWGNLLLLTSHSHTQTDIRSPQENNMCIWFRSNRSKRIALVLPSKEDAQHGMQHCILSSCHSRNQQNARWHLMAAHQAAEPKIWTASHCICHVLMMTCCKMQIATLCCIAKSWS